MATTPFVLSLEGNIGAGKSTVLAALRQRFASHPNVVFVAEPVAEWERAGLLAAMYSGALSHVAFQMTAMATRYSDLSRALATPGVSLLVAERSLASDRRIFAQTHLRGIEATAYETAADALTAALPPARHATVLIDVPVATLQERVAQRGREAERDGADGGGGGGSADYLRTLDVAHEKYYEQLGHPKARVDGTPPTDDVVAAVVAAARALGAPLGGEPARKTPSAERA